ncbi:hypothetical protein AD428_00100 [Achromobacter sp. DMS1]|uniref:hypothetical protein n=1 Tax=Achromobacter sp. DMS1 TaxID=1688405 RepID=UPI00069EE7CE|nr:hypothetical protein [Achromobacter sp. DMS1]KOF55523.1 hypothetical protein AD428_00100 [Achromobacter sp. DMS1]
MSTEIALNRGAEAVPAPGHALGQVANDWQAAEVWLAVLQARPASPQTLDTYRREIRRLRWYCDTQGRPPPSAWTYQDGLRYVRFLTEEAGRHIRPAGLRYGDPGWTPFLGTLSPSSVADARKILHTMFKFWMNAGYVPRNPFAGQAGRARRTSAPSRRALPQAATDFVLTFLDARPKSTARDHLRYYRDRFLFLLLLHTGIRAHEAAAAAMGDVEARTDPQSHRIYWALRLRTQKGGGEGTALLNSEVMAAFHGYS